MVTWREAEGARAAAQKRVEQVERTSPRGTARRRRCVKAEHQDKSKTKIGAENAETIQIETQLR